MCGIPAVILNFPEGKTDKETVLIYYNYHCGYLNARRVRGRIKKWSNDETIIRPFLLYWFILFQMRNDLTFVVQELFCDIEIFSSRLRFTDHDFLRQRTRSACQEIDAVGEEDGLVNVVGDEEGG